MEGIKIIFFWLFIGAMFYGLGQMQAHLHAREDRQTTAVIIEVHFDEGFFLAPSNRWVYTASTPFGVCSGSTTHPVEVGTKFNTVFFRGECNI
jgi:hypothetical protein